MIEIYLLIAVCKIALFLCIVFGALLSIVYVIFLILEKTEGYIIKKGRGKK